MFGMMFWSIDSGVIPNAAPGMEKTVVTTTTHLQHIKKP